MNKIRKPKFLEIMSSNRYLTGVGPIANMPEKGCYIEGITFYKAKQVRHIAAKLNQIADWMESQK